MSQGGISSVKKTASTASAPIWKAYLAIRSSSFTNTCNTKNTIKESYQVNRCRGRKRQLPLTSRSEIPGATMWMKLTTSVSGGEDNRALVLENIRHYWDELSVSGRQEILFLEEPEMVKQLYKLNLSLLCVGLMQRHLKTSKRATKTATLPSTRICTDTSSEKTYELLEAMEFMDIGTAIFSLTLVSRNEGILTVKTELVENTDRLFTLVGNVLDGFLTSIHVLTDSNFNKLFVMESETINTWANYQCLIAMLVEQLILRSYVSYLEKEAAKQMEQLLLEVSLEDTCLLTSSTIHGKKKKKKKKKGKSATRATHQIDEADLVRSDIISGHRISDENQLKTADSFTKETIIVDSVVEPMPEPTLLTRDSACQSIAPIKSMDEVKAQDTDGNKTEHRAKKPSLNPNAIDFHPQKIVPATEDSDMPVLFVGKRKYEEYIVNVPWEDIDSGFGSNNSFEGKSSLVEDEEDDKGAHQRTSKIWQHNKSDHIGRWREQEDAKLEKQLRKVYASTASLIGWDFVRQCEVPNPNVRPVWSNSTLWKTTPRHVVRYFSHENGDELSVPYFLPTTYYFNPEPSIQCFPPLLSVPDFEQSLNRGFQAPLVVSPLSDPKNHKSSLL
ncbi:hypothetical protein PsorP6_008462 [Peronosclerospora sorghi]|uniref:Uncharacterized protein n=1 Tax=Peronosclerospora sorghi TaxID=230839 RepID=A0ACC0WBA5_9STRA|nr:hypothetical protein PsorP6_008462 [Peronosclerospora sorghi]